MPFGQLIDYPGGKTTLGSSYTAGSSSVVLATGTATAFLAGVAPSSTAPVYFTIASAANPASCTHYACTGVSGDVLTGVTVLAGIDRNYNLGDAVFASIYAEHFEAITDAIADISSGTADTLAGYDDSGNFAGVSLGAGLSLDAGTLAATGGTGTVTTVSVATANGFGGTVATATTTPAITITTGVTGLLKGDGTGVSAATSGTDYVVPSVATLSSLSSVGTIATGTWQATAIGAGYGGTGATSLTAHAVVLGNGTSAVSFATIGTAGRVLVDQGAGADPAFAAVSGDGSLSSAGALTVAKVGGKSVTLGGALTTSGAFALTLTTTAATNVTLPTSGTLATTSVATLSSLTSIGTIGTGTWQATPVGIAYGGTGQATATAGFGALSPLTTKGDTLAYGTSNARLAVGADGAVLTADSTQTLGVKWAAISGSGTVTTVSVVTANGLAGSVANATTTPAITLSTTITGILKGDGTAISAATAGTDYVSPTGDGSGLTGITATQVGLGSVTNDAQTKASIVPNTAPAAGRILVGNAGGTAYAPVALSNDATISAAGALTITKINTKAITLAAAFTTSGAFALTLTVTASTNVTLPTSGTLATTASTFPAGQITGLAASATTDTTVATNISSGTLAAARLPTTGLTVTQHISPITTDTDGATVTFDLSVADWHQVTLGGNRTLALSNAAVGQQFNLLIQQAASGGPYSPTWFSGITWMNASHAAPSMPTTASAYLSATFKCIATNTYLGWWLGNSAS